MSITFEKKEHIVKPGVYIPKVDIEFPENPNEPWIHPEIVNPTDFENNYPFLDKSFKHRLMSNLIYIGMVVIVFPLQKIRYGLKVKGRKNLRKNRKLFKNGALTVSNHIYRWDFPAVFQATHRKMWYPARAVQVESKDKNLIRYTGGIPIPETLGGLRGFNKAFDELHEKKKWIHVFPEACRWEFYEPIRPFIIGAFKMAYKYEIPVIPLVFSYREPKGIYKLFKVKHPLLTITIGEPISPVNDKGMSRNEFCNYLRHQAHEQMVKMAGIEQNMWPVEGD